MEETKQQGQAITWSSVFQERYQKFRYFWYFFILFYFMLLTSTKKQTNKQTNGKNVGRDTATAVANYSGPGY